MPQPLTRILACACAVVFLAGVVSAATRDDGTVVVDQASPDLHSDDGTTTSTVAAGSVPPTRPDTITTETAPPRSETTAPPATTAPPTTATTAPTSTTDPTAGTTPGTYDYDITGTVDGEPISGTSTLVVDEVGPDGRQRHVQSGPDGETVTVYRHAPEGTYLESLALESDQGSFALEATEPFLLLPTDAPTGTTTHGTLTGEGITARVTFTVAEVGPETTTATLEVVLSGKIQGFDVDGTMDSTIVARSDDQLPLDTKASSDLSVAGGLVRIQSETRSVLRR